MSEQRVENKAVVNIFGEDYPITGVTDPSHISEIADYVDSKMRDVAQSSKVIGRDRIAILAAMSIASELLETRCRIDDFQEDIDSTADGLLKRLDEALT
jgi:cell division protein ZapA